jgi:predicted transcriptional regulator
MIFLMKYQDDMRIIEIKEALNVGESVVKKFLK